MQTPQTTRPSENSPLRAAVGRILDVIASPFRKSIWTEHDDYHFGKCSEEEFDIVASMYAVVAAKLNIPFPTLRVCLVLAAEVARLPDNPIEVDGDELALKLKEYLRATVMMSGIGIPIALCVLATFKRGQYAPLDRKVADGLANLDVITEAEANRLTGKSIDAIAQIYVSKVLPEWHHELQRRTPEQVDAYWGTSADI